MAINLEIPEITRYAERFTLEEMRGTAEGEAAYRQYQDAYSRAIARVSISDRFKG